MSTSLNNAVFELYTEFFRMHDEEKKKHSEDVNQVMENLSIKSRLKRGIKNPALIFLWAYQKIASNIKNYCAKSKNEHIEVSNRLNNDRSMKPNVFIPTDKKFPDVKIAVYTAITGGYDNLKNPIYIDDDLDYYAFTDAENTYGGGGIFGKCFQSQRI